MTADRQRRFRWALALALGLWGVASMQALSTLRTARLAALRQSTRRSALAALAADAARLEAHEDAARALAAAAADAPPFDFAGWLAALRPEWTAAQVRARTEFAGARFAWLTVEAEWQGLPARDFAAIVAAAEARHPPLRLRAATLDPWDDAGRLQVRATFETVARSAAP